MKNIIKLLILLFTSNITFAQTAVDFTTDDCNGVSHNLYDSLDVGNVIVLAWVMPCGPCATYTLPAYSAVQSFALSHPNKVHFYLVDDFANTACPTLVNWGNSNNMPLNTAFSSSMISMNDYGSNGMPKVVVLGGANHSVYYNENDNKINFNGVQGAISNALSSPLNTNDDLAVNDFNISVFPNPTANILNICYESNKSFNVVFEIVNVLGKTVYYSTDNNTLSCKDSGNKNINMSQFKKGVYFLNILSESFIHTERIILTN